MLDALNLSNTLTKGEYRRRFPELQSRLHRLQRACWQDELAVIVVFEGWNGSGRGAVIRKATQRLEPRGFTLHNITGPRTHEVHLPWMWRFWVKLPSWGRMAIFDRSWYRRVLIDRVEGVVGEREWTQAYSDITSFERALADDRYAFVKFFLHISKEEQRARLEKLEADPATSWRVQPKDWQQHEKYDEYFVATEEMLERTESEWGPWTLVEAHDQDWSRIKVMEAMISSIEEALKSRGSEVPPLDEDPVPVTAPIEGAD